MLKWLLHGLFPVRCAVCQSPLHDGGIPYLCAKHTGELIPLGPGVCPDCSLPFHVTSLKICSDCGEFEWAFDGARSLYLYEKPLSGLIAGFKYEKKPHLIRTFQKLLQSFQVQTDWAGFQAGMIVPVPLIPEKEKERGFNQAALLAKAVGRHFKIPVNQKILYRKKSFLKGNSGKPLAQMNRQERLRCISGSFAAGKNKNIAGEKILLVDDVLTTGATTQECASVLKEAGAAAVYVWTLARTPVKTEIRNIY